MSNKKKTTLRERATLSGLRERYCGKCKHVATVAICPYIQVCQDAYVRGYIKGAKSEKISKT